jgi:hypothetical protein
VDCHLDQIGQFADSAADNASCVTGSDDDAIDMVAKPKRRLSGKDAQFNVWTGLRARDVVSRHTSNGSLNGELSFN